MAHEEFMSEALRLAGRGVGRTSPNPAVGAVVVKNGLIIGRGYHRRAGLAHAEIEALRGLNKATLRGGRTLCHPGAMLPQRQDRCLHKCHNRVGSEKSSGRGQ